jgi:acetyltransferase-like isoleucine patch superfamily enzyme
VKIGEGAEIGTGAVIVPGCAIGDWSIVGAGAVVTGNVPDDATAVGVPARVVKQRPKGWQLA